jgi:hypothetical protein
MSTTEKTAVAPPEAAPTHPQHHNWLMRTVNAGLDIGVFVITAGRVQLNTGGTGDVNPDIEKGTLIDPPKPKPPILGSVHTESQPPADGPGGGSGT